ncbi:MAG TPA: M28 family peptidase [Longimicrobiales bacterium]
MIRHSMLPLLTALVLNACAGGDAPPADAEGPVVDPAASGIQGADIERHLRTLSDDRFQGRGPGSEGGDAAIQYVAEQFAAAGLEPVDGSWLQAVPMIGNTPDPRSATLRIAGEGEVFDGVFRDDFVIWAGDPEARSSSASGELVFVGYGVSAPENQWDDFGDVDLTGKVLMILVSDPPAPADEPDLFGGRAMTYYGRWTYKFEEAARQGAAAAFVVHDTEPAGYGWNVVTGSWTGEQFSLPADPGAPAPVAVEGWLTLRLAEEILGVTGLEIEELQAQAARRDFQPVATGIQVSTSLTSAVRTVDTHNVVGVLRGGERPDEIITLTSHHDHLGVGEPVNGDAIYNGAYDNASGTAMLIELADAISHLDARPARSLLFIATAAEEQGLLGAEWYVQNPLYPLARTVAEINMDGANLWGETDDVIAMGADRSELGAVVEPRAAELGMYLAPDAEPEKGFFFRSDHFPFAKAGVPALYIEHGRVYRNRPEGWGQQVLDDFTANRYHGPADEYLEEFVFEGAVQQAQLILLTTLDLANSDAWPNWNEGSEFRAARDAMMMGGG